MNAFDAQLLRLKEALGVTQDQDVAAALGLTKQAFSIRRKRGSFPTDKVLALVSKMGLDAALVLTGRPSEPFDLGSFESRVEALKQSTETAEKLGVPEARDALYQSRESASGTSTLISRREARLLASFRKIPEEGKQAVESACFALENASAVMSRKEPSYRPKPAGPDQPSIHEAPGTYAGKRKNPSEAT